MIERTNDGNVDPYNNSELFETIGKEVAQKLHLMKIDGKYLTANGEKTAVGIGRMVYSICQEQIVEAS